MSGKRKIGTRLIAAGAVCLLAAAVLLLYNLNRDWDAKNADDRILSALDQAVELGEYHSVADPVFPDDMDSVHIDGVDYIGYLTIPELELELPVTKTWSYEKMKLAPCRYSGSVRDGSLVICGHNYRSHFGPLDRLSSGSEVLFRDVHNVITRYEVTEVEVLPPSAIDRMKNSGADLTLFTCTYSGTTRYTVRCARVGTAAYPVK